MNDEVKEKIRQFIKDNKLSPYTVYTDYNDDFTTFVSNRLNDIEIGTKTAEEIRDDLINEIYDLYGMDDYDYAYDTAINEIMENEEFKELDREDIFDFLHNEDLIEVDYSEVINAMMNTELRVNFLLDGDIEDECVVAEKIMDGDTSENLSGMLNWLIEKQGHKAEELAGDSDNKFIKSLKEEIENRYIGGFCNIVVLKRYDTEQVINAIAQGGQVMIQTDNMIGFHNRWDGAGSLLEIELEKPMTITSDMYSVVEFEDADNKDKTGYTVDEISGLVGSCWKK